MSGSVPSNQVFANGSGVILDANLNTFVQGGMVVANLRNFTGISNMTVATVGQATPGDGLGQLYYWNATSTSSDNGVTIIQPTGVLVGRWLSTGLVPISPAMQPVVQASTTSAALVDLGISAAMQPSLAGTVANAQTLLGIPTLPALLNVQVLTASSGTYTPSSSAVVAIQVSLSGGGGGAGSAAASSAGNFFSCSSGGAAGSWGITQIITSGFSSVSYACGAAGAGGTSGGSGTAGGITNFGSYFAPGGGGGNSTPNSGQGQATGGVPGAAPFGGTFILAAKGNPGCASAGAPTLFYTYGGIGGGSPFGSPGAHPSYNNAANAGSGYGAGGTGVVSTNGNAAIVGAAGLPGVILVYEFGV